jgi:bifunctional polynucleotide phosphatase/kinase
MSNKDPYIILKHQKFRFRKKMAGFDYDDTLVKPKSKSTFSKDIDDWVFLRGNVKSKIQELYNKGYAIVIFTNQTKYFKKYQIENVLNSLEIPYICYIMYDKQIKKPNPQCFLNYLGDKKIGSESFYVGDALGRENDWSDSDKIFAENCNLKYISPEEMFPFKERKTQKIILSDDQELIIMVGYPGSGKSTFVKKNFNDYLILSGDILKTESKILKQLEKGIDEGKSIVIDATNPSKEKRSVFIEIAKKKGIRVRIIHITTSIEESLLQNQKRDIKVPKIAFYVYRKKFSEPDKDEGVDEIIKL